MTETADRVAPTQEDLEARQRRWSRYLPREWEHGSPVPELLRDQPVFAELEAERALMLERRGDAERQAEEQRAEDDAAEGEWREWESTARDAMLAGHPMPEKPATPRPDRSEERLRELHQKRQMDRMDAAVRAGHPAPILEAFPGAGSDAFHVFAVWERTIDAEEAGLLAEHADQWRKVLDDLAREPRVRLAQALAEVEAAKGEVGQYDETFAAIDEAAKRAPETSGSSLSDGEDDIEPTATGW